ncbi:hypothetical protein RB614_31410 [Phytohabitans sp. ZYX-F-186]|uniref:Uncharacterized protein n=1 Tax=Phytohabitans maris TaxID=3071409 RepID=A0ABU0ZPT4_9ACTN|nr:hypothetical protein [Phytohabitans sp. ZYX-F-186]MDQ7909041.1 hypothetical protein [Phytohabitans sp. ZYX-F-186]
MTIVLLALGEWGANLAQVIALPFAIYGTASAIFARREPAAHHAPVGQRKKVVVGAVTLLVGAVLPGLGWLWYDRYTDVNVHVGEAFQLSEQAPATVEPRLSRSGWRGELTFTPTLTAVGSLGDCVLPARLMITPVVDGQHLAVKEARHGTEAAIAIPEGADTVKLQITLVVPPNQGCILTVTLARIVLHRMPW